jgi:PhnB protein
MARPEGWHSVTTRIVTDDVPGFVAFLRQTFGATGDVVADRPTVVRIGDSNLMVSIVGPRPSTASFLHVYVDDTDATYRRALDAAATSLEAPLDTPYGDRRAMVQDRWGNVWQIGTYRQPG